MAKAVITIEDISAGDGPGNQALEIRCIYGESEGSQDGFDKSSIAHLLARKIGDETDSLIASLVEKAGGKMHSVEDELIMTDGTYKKEIKEY